MNPLRVLITNNTLAERAGTELYVRDLALALLDRGHRPVAFSTSLGAVAAELRAATVPVIGRLDALAEPPDIIHGHHHVDTMLALTHFPDTPAVFICHGWAPWEEHPPRFGRIRRYLAVDEACRDRLVCENGFAPERVELLLNFVDLGRFQRRGPLPDRPKKALLFANTAREDTYLPAVREACVRVGVELDTAGTGVGRPLDHPEQELGKYDLVFAKGRAALEALAVGAAVILCDLEGAGPLVCSQRYDGLRRQNFGLRALRRPHTPEEYEAEIRRYDSADAAALCTRIRSEADRDVTIDRLVAIYRAAIAEHEAAEPPNRAVELRQLNAYLRWLAPRTVELAQVHHALQNTLVAVHHLQSINELTHAELASRTAEHHRQWREVQAELSSVASRLGESERARAELAAAYAAERPALTAEIAILSGQRAALEAELAAMRATPAVRLHRALRRVPGLRPAAHWLRRLGRRVA